MLELLNILPPDEKAAKEAKERLDAAAKPKGSLGELENIIIKLAALTGSADIDISKKAVVTVSADNGAVKHGISSAPSEITARMTKYIAENRTAVGIMAKCAGADAISVDMGMFNDIGHERVINRRIANGTNDMTVMPAMTEEQAEKAIKTGIELVGQLKDDGYRLIATGEMGIGNTTAASAVISVLMGKAPEEVTGRGAGLDDEGLKLKISAIKKAIEVNKPDKNDAAGVIAKVGSFDIAGMCGMFLGGALYRIPVIADGFISSAAALAAKHICEKSAAAMIASHLSKEPASAMVLDELGLKPIIHAEMRLGEGTGAAALMPILDMAVSVYKNIITMKELMT